MQCDESLIANYGCDVIKGIIIILLILLAGLASAYTPEQQTTLDGMNLSFKLGIAHEKASQGQNVIEFNILVDEYNTWIRQHFGEDASLLKSKINETIPNKIAPNETILSKTTTLNETTALNEPILNETATLNEDTLNEIAPETAPIEITPIEPTPGLKNPFKPGSDLSKFGKQQVYVR